MQATSRQRSGGAQGQRRFATTRWSLVNRAREPDGRQALAELCRAYWYPVQVFIQGYGLSAVDAADVTQGFFEAVLARNDLAKVDRERGRFRCWLRKCARNYLYNWFKRNNTAAHGGGAVHVPFEDHCDALRDELTPERSFDRRWALTVIDRAVSRLRHRYERANKGAHFAELQAGLWGGACDDSDRELALRLRTTVGALKVQRHRLRHRFQECLRAEVAETVASPDEVDDELRRLIHALS